MIYLKELLLLLFICSGQNEEILDSPTNVILEHSFDGKLYNPRGWIRINSFKSGSLLYHQNGPLNASEKEAFKRAVEQNGFYYLQIHFANDHSPYMSTFMKVCALSESGLSEIINIVIDPADGGHILGMSAFPLDSYCTHKLLDWENLNYFNTTVEAQFLQSAPVPDTATYIQKLEQEKKAKERGEAKDNRSFFAKYWMYIIPVVIFLMLSNSAASEASGQ